MSYTSVIEQQHNTDFIQKHTYIFNPTALRKAKIVYNFGLSECKRVKNSLSTVLMIRECSKENLDEILVAAPQ